jgi:hypothetical protein
MKAYSPVVETSAENGQYENAKTGLPLQTKRKKRSVQERDGVLNPEHEDFLFQVYFMKISLRPTGRKGIENQLQYTYHTHTHLIYGYDVKLSLSPNTK